MSFCFKRTAITLINCSFSHSCDLLRNKCLILTYCICNFTMQMCFWSFNNNISNEFVTDWPKTIMKLMKQYIGTTFFFLAAEWFHTHTWRRCFYRYGSYASLNIDSFWPHKYTLLFESVFVLSNQNDIICRREKEIKFTNYTHFFRFHQIVCIKW